ISSLKDLGKDIRSLRAEGIVKYLKNYEILNIPAVPPEYLTEYDKLSEKLENVINFSKKRNVNDFSTLNPT
ncbi:MAG: hypothetical protein ACFFDI_13865, partial [Promethearchaeota archaeon]